MALGGAVLALALVVFGAPVPAMAADMALTVTPTAATAKSNEEVKYTLTYSCSSASGTCANSVITIPTGTVTGNAANTDFSLWVTAGTCPAVNRSVAGQISFALGTLDSSTKTCQFTVRAPEYTTLDGASATLTPTLSSTGLTAVTATPATLTLTAGHNNSLKNSAPTRAITGNNFDYAINYSCGLVPSDYSGDIGISQIVITATLPANFEYQSSRFSSALPGTASYNPATRVLTYTDPTGKSCGNPPLNVSNQFTIFVTGKATTGGVANPVGSTVCNSASASWTYIDGVTGSGTTPTVCTTMINLAVSVAKGTTTPGNLSNLGQFPAADGGALAPYTYPGDWDTSGAGVYYDITMGTNPATAAAGVAYDIKDPMPCLTNVTNNNYSSNAPGTICANPAFIPTLIQPFGFPVTTADTITLTYTDGSTGTVPYTTARSGWVIPTSPTVAEVNVPAIASQGNNTATTMRLRMFGHAASSVPTPAVLTNRAVSTPYAAGDTTSPLLASATVTSRLEVVAPPASSAAFVYPGVTMTRVAQTCTVNANLNSSANAAYSSRIEVPTAPSQAIYIDYLAPRGSIAVNPATTAFQLNTFNINGAGGKSFTTPVITPTVTPNYNGTDRTLVRYTIPAGVITTPGYYNIRSSNLVALTLEAGCAGDYTSDITIGYGAPIAQCYFNNYVSNHIEPAPMYPFANADLRDNGSPIADNYCGYSATLKIAPIRPGFSVNKTVQGNLDAGPISGTNANGHVSTEGGTATYRVTFLNSGESTLADPVMYDILPRVGDTQAISTSPRNSQFTVGLTSVGTAPARMTVAYSTAANPCRPEVLAANPGCVDDWSTTPPTPLSSTTALRLSYSGSVTVGTSFGIDYTVSTPVATAGLIANNSVGTNAKSGDGFIGTGLESPVRGLQTQSAQPAITKTADRSTVSAVGQQIVYTFTVTNNTAVTLSNVGVTDALVDSAPSSVAPAATCTALTSPAATCSGATTTLIAGQSATFTATYTTTQADLDHGSISDQGTASATPPTGPALSNSSEVVTVAASQAPALSLVKSADPETVDSVGDEVEYTFTVTNTGNVSVRNLAIAEGAFSGSGALSAITCPAGTIAPAAIVTCTATYPVTQADLTAGSISNTATATAATFGGASVASADSTAVVDVDQVASLSLVKSATPSGADAYNAGQVISYSFVVTNTGNVPVTGIAVNEVEFTGSEGLPAVTCPATALDPAQQMTCTASYELSQDDVDSGSLRNTANATGTSATGPVTSDDSSVVTPQTPISRLTLTKSANTAFVNAADDVISYSFLVRNTGNVTIHDVEVEESAFSGAGTDPVVNCPADVLTPGQQMECTAGYTVLQADMNAGSVVNTARVVGVDPTDADVESAASTWTVAANTAPAISVLKTADVTTYDEVGDVIGFTFLITNTGNVLLSGVEISEGAFTGTGDLDDVTCPVDELAPTATVTCEADYTVTQADLDRGSIANTATAFGYAPAEDDATVSTSSTVTVAALQSPALELVKSATPTVVDAAGDTVTYEFRVTNTGNVTLTSLAISEIAFSGTGAVAAPACPGGALAPDAERTCVLTYQVTQADVDAGEVVNTAVATARLGTAPVESDESTATVDIEREPGLSLVKSAEPAAPADFHAGETITYTFVITNTGNVTITDAGVVEGDFSGTGPLPDPTCASTAPLAPGDQLVCTTTYTVTQEDIDAASVVNTATATGTAPGGVQPPTSPASTVTVPEPANPGLALVKSTDTTRLQSVGQIVTYRFAVTNTGNTTASGISISEDSFSGKGEVPAADCPAGPLLPGQTITCTARYSVVLADLTGRSLTNTATASSQTPAGATTVSSPSSAEIADVADETPPLASTGLALDGITATAAASAVVAGVLLALVGWRRRRAQH